MSRLTKCVKIANCSVPVWRYSCRSLTLRRHWTATRRNSSRYCRTGARCPRAWPSLQTATSTSPRFDGSKKIFVFNQNGGLLRTLTINASSGFLLGVGFHPHTGAFLVIDFGAGKVLNVDPQTGTASDFITTTLGDSPTRGSTR